MYSSVNKEKLNKAIENAAGITRRNIIKFQDYMPIYQTKNGIYPYQKNTEPHINDYNWARGFWAGIVWLLYELEPGEHIKIYAKKLTQNINMNINKRGLLHSNMGFLVIPACIPDYRFTKSSTAKETIVMAANNLMTKYSSNHKFICYYDHELDGDELCCITSNLVNSQLLYFAYQFSGNTKYKEIAKTDIDSVIKNNINSDGKTYFNSYFNNHTGEKLNGPQNMPNALHDDVPFRSYTISDGLATRAYAWALYGLSVSYAHTKNDYYKEKFSDVFDYLVKNNREGEIFEHSFKSKNKTSYPDSVSTAIIAASLSDFIKHDENRNSKYEKKLFELANLLIDNHSSSLSSNNECLIVNGYQSENKKDKSSTLFGDYFYFEMLMNLKNKERESFWYNKK